MGAGGKHPWPQTTTEIDMSKRFEEAMQRKYERIDDCKKEAKLIAEKGISKDKDVKKLLALIIEILSIR